MIFPTFFNVIQKSSTRACAISSLAILLATGFANISFAQSTQTGKSGLPLPRFVSIKSERVNMRVGPGKEFKVEWMYLKKGLPMEIIQEFDNWRKVRDPEGNEGWILHSLLSGNRTVIIAPWNSDKKEKLVDMKTDQGAASSLRAQIEPGVVADVEECSIDWCRLEASGNAGFVEKNALWGVYPDEIIEN